MKIAALLGICCLIIGCGTVAVIPHNHPATFSDLGNGIIFVDTTKVSWPKEARHYVTAMSWADASKYVEGLNSAQYLGHTDWRLPTAEELMTLVDDRNGKSGQEYLESKGFVNVGYEYWSSSSNTLDWTGSIYVNIAGGAYGQKAKYATEYVWPVRSGK